VITQIDFDHENYLGHSIEEIAAEKAGIIKPGARVVSAAEHLIARVVIRRRVAEQSAFLVEIENEFRIENITSHNGCFAFTAISNDSGAGIPLALPLPAASRFATRSRRWPPQECSPNAARRLMTARLRAASPQPYGPAGWSASPGSLKFISTAPIILQVRANRRILANAFAWAEHLPHLWRSARQSRR